MRSRRRSGARYETWGIVIETLDAPVTGDARGAVADDGRVFAVIVPPADDADPAAVLAAARYWELRLPMCAGWSAPRTRRWRNTCTNTRELWVGMTRYVDAWSSDLGPRAGPVRRFGSIIEPPVVTRPPLIQAGTIRTTTTWRNRPQILLTLLQILTYALIGRALLSWFDPRGNGPSRAFGGSDRARHRAAAAGDPPVGMLDLSFIVAIILIQVLQRLLRQALL